MTENGCFRQAVQMGPRFSWTGGFLAPPCEFNRLGKINAHIWLDDDSGNSMHFLQSRALLSNKVPISIVVLWTASQQGCVSLGTSEVGLSTHVQLLHQTDRTSDFTQSVVGFWLCITSAPWAVCVALKHSMTHWKQSNIRISANHHQVHTSQVAPLWPLLVSSLWHKGKPIFSMNAE